MSTPTALVLGLGESGLAMARWSARCGATVRVWDSREAPPHAAALAQHVPGATLYTGALPDEVFQRLLDLGLEGEDAADLVEEAFPAPPKKGKRRKRPRQGAYRRHDARPSASWSRRPRGPRATRPDGRILTFSLDSVGPNRLRRRAFASSTTPIRPPTGTRLFFLCATRLSRADGGAAGKTRT